METKECFIGVAEKRLNNYHKFDKPHYDCIFTDFGLYGWEFEPITWEEVKEELIKKGYKYYDLEDSVITNKYAKELGLIDDEDDDEDETYDGWYTKYYFVDRAEKSLDNGFSFSECDFNSIINDLELREEKYEHITWEELKEELIANGWKYCYWEDSIVTDEYAKELGLIEEENYDWND